MINANSLITRCVRSALCTQCAEVTIPMGHTTANTQPFTSASATLAPSNISQALDHVVSLLDPQQAAAILALKPCTTPPGEAAVVNSYFNELLQRKAAAPTANHTSTSSH